MSGFNRLLKNSVANIINGFSNVILGVVITPFLISILSQDEFSVWSICLQVGIAISILGVAGQITIGRFTSLTKIKGEQQEFGRNINNYLSIVFYESIILFVLISLIIINFQIVFPSVPSNLIHESKLTFLLVSSSFVFGLYATVFIGYFIGVEKNHITANINLISRVGIGIGVVFAAKYGITVMAFVYFLVNLLSYALMYVQFKKLEWHQFSIRFKGKLDELIKFFGGLIIWNVAQFLISGIGLFVVSIYDFKNLPYFVLAMTMVNAIVGLLGAIVNPIIQPIVKLNEAGKRNAVDKLVISLSLIFSLSIFLGVNISNYISLPILQTWAGDINGVLANGYFNYLLVAFAIRMVVAPYGMKLVANAQQLKIAHYPIFEGVINLILSVFFVKEYGAIGVAYGTIISALAIIFVYAIKFSLETVQRKLTLSIFLSLFFVPILSVLSVFLFSSFLKSGCLKALITILSFLSLFFIKKSIFTVKGIVNEIKTVC